MLLKQSIDWRNEWFPIDDATYLNFAAHAAIPRVALNAVRLSAEAKMRPHIVDDQTFFSVAASLRQTLATLIGASPDEVALTSGAGAGLAAIAYALKWSDGDEVIYSRGEFPVQYATWKPMEAREGIKVRIAVPQGQFVQSDDLVASLTPSTRVVSVSHVRFDDGSMLDVSSLAAACKRNGTLLVLDVSQSCGAVPMNVRTLGADFIVCAGYKYLLSPWGTGFLWMRKENLDSLRPGPYNWLSQGVESFARLNYVDPEPAPTLSRWDSAEAASIYNFNLTVMEASAKFVLEAGPSLIRDHNQALIDYFFERLPEGYRLASPRQASQRGVFGCIEARTRGDTEFLYQMLREERFVVALREGKIRVAPHLLNSTQDIDRLLVAMAKAWKDARHDAH
ncbi:MAG TPA: aminotransferase class V-fold PLP-dependent enzyme [Terriglobales bacterium]|nr:aminotransferase class V-fold PLP-dependent enzyme [Terriglobales bacterium]HWZ75205.1 aminotransferase class V-fold PLP-dependent enzyme [Candidatus Sulfotelmatobacter sp.]